MSCYYYENSYGAKVPPEGFLRIPLLVGPGLHF